MKLKHILFFASLALPTAMGRVGVESSKEQRRDKEEAEKAKAFGEVTVEIDFDDYPEETGFKIKQGNNVLFSRAAGTFSGMSSYTEDIQLMNGEYTFEITDTAGDGICCDYGQGRYRVSYHFCTVMCAIGYFVDGNGVFGYKKTHSFTMWGPNNPWLNAHNTRRRELHESYNTEYVPLTWSASLANGAQAYADQLIAQNGCNLQHSNGNYGENLAATSASSHTPDDVLHLWYDNEYISFPSVWELNQNGHFTQVGWRASEYLGCGQASKSGCTISVCRYISPGNCNINSSNWLEKMLADHSPCGPHCPPGGC